MKHLVLFISGTILFCISLQAQETKKVLFLGNSYTAVNNLPNLVSELALSAGDTLVFDSNTPGGYTLEQHSQNATSINKINSEQWDYVVLQEQSQRPSFPPSQVENEVLPYAHQLDSLIQANDSCSTTLFYMTWGRKNGDAANCPFYPPLCTYEGMQQRLRESYLLMAQLNNASVAPVGAAWQQVMENYPSIELYASDESHPSIYGSYLAACVFYASIFQKSPQGLHIPSGISAGDGATLQNAALIVFDSLQTWNIDTTNVNADFTYSNNQYEIGFQNLSLNAEFYLWDFGDGSFSGDENPLHTFAPGSYSVVLTAYKDCDSSQVSSLLEIPEITGIDPTSNDAWKIFPNPVGDVLLLYGPKGTTNFNVSVFDISGRKLKLRSPSNPFELDCSGFVPGVYFIRIEVDGAIIIRKFMKE